MKKWKIFVTFFRNLYDDHYTVDRSWNPGNYAFVKVNEKYALEMGDNKLSYEVLFENDFPGYRPDLQVKGYCENSVLYHLYINGVHEAYDYIGFVEYDHVLGGDFTREIQEKLDGADGETIFSFQKFTFRQLWDQAILMNPRRREKVDGRPDSTWNCINVILKDYNDYYQTAHTVDRLAAKDCFPICHSFLIPTRIFAKIMPFHVSIMESGKVEGYHRHNWRSPAILMERYMAVALALEDAPIDDGIQLEHRAYPVRVFKPDWFAPSFWRKAIAYLQKKF